MTRKDTILIAVLVNAALLVVLFVTAIKSEDVHPISANQNAALLKKVTSPQKEIQTARGDEIDQVLQEFTKKSLSLKEEKKVQATPKVEEKAIPKIDFAKELQAITKAANQHKKVAPVSSGYKEVTVKKGDALSKIARAHNTSVNAIMDLNHLKSTVLRIGQVLKIPGGKQERKERSGISSNAEYYTVKNGDNPWTIAVKNHIKVNELLKLNDLNEDKARRLKPGDQLRIR